MIRRGDRGTATGVFFHRTAADGPLPAGRSSRTTGLVAIVPAILFIQIVVFHARKTGRNIDDFIGFGHIFQEIQSSIQVQGTVH